MTLVPPLPHRILAVIHPVTTQIIQYELLPPPPGKRYVLEIQQYHNFIIDNFINEQRPFLTHTIRHSSIIYICFLLNRQYPPSPFTLFFFDQMHQWRVLQQQQNSSGNDVDPSQLSLKTKGIINNGDDDATVEMDTDDATLRMAPVTTTTLLPSTAGPTSPQPRKNQRQPTQFAIRVGEISHLWKQLSTEERTIWEQRAYAKALMERDDHVDL